MKLSLLLLILSFDTVYANLVLEDGSYANRTHLDMSLMQANLNFKYTGCDQNPSKDKIRLEINPQCRPATDFSLTDSSGKRVESGTIGEVTAKYAESGTCSNPVTSSINTQVTLDSVYKDFEANGCKPTFLLLKDGTTDFKRWKIKDVKDKSLCRLPDTKITKKNFPTDDHSFFNMKANDNGFKIGDHTHYRFDYDKRQWCVKFRDKADKCGQWPSPLPMVYEDPADKKFHVKGAISLNNNGLAVIRAMDKSYASINDVYKAQAAGEFAQTDQAKGRIDFQTWRKQHNGLVRSIVRSYETDGPRAVHQRSINFFARNIFGTGITYSWCDKENCFTDVTAEKLQTAKCTNVHKEIPQVNVGNGGNGNLCHSCIGILPGHCAIEQEEVKVIKSALAQDEAFTILDTGEYKFGQNVEKGLVNNFSRIVEHPQNPGCHAGYAPTYQEIFDPGEALRDADNGRSIDLNNGAL